MLKKKLVILNTVILLGLGSVFYLPTASAERSNDLQSQQTQIQQERSELKSTLSKAEQQIADILEELEALTEQIERVNQAIEDNKQMIVETEEDIEEAQAEIEVLEAEVEALQLEIDIRTELLKERAITYQKNGTSVRYIEVILGSQDFGDFVDRILAINKIAKADSDFIRQHEESKRELEEKQAVVAEKLDALNEMMTELEGMQHHLLDQQEQNDQLKAELNEKEKKSRDIVAELVKQDEQLAAKEADIRQRIAEERTRRAQLQNTSSSSSSTASTSSSNQTVSRSNTSTAAVSGSLSDVLTVGNRYIGRSVYVFGGGRTEYDIQNGRFDCSGFTRWAFSQIGVNLGYSTDSQKSAGRQVSKSELRPGDLVFFNTYKTDGHVGIYLGNNKFIGSQSSTGVAIASMNDSYWGPRYSRAVRVVE